jgi:MATE family multidrug resistance protein
MLRLAAIYVLGETVMAVVSGALRGAGDTVFTMFLSVGMHWFLLPIAIIGLHVLGWTPATTWAVQIGVFAICAGLFWWRWQSGRWRAIRVVEPPPRQIASDHDMDFHEGPP